MQYRHELVRLDEGLKAKIYVHSVMEVTAHWHHEIELMMVLKGSIELRRNNQVFNLAQDDVLLINHNELHSIKATDENNILLAIQFSPDLMNNCYPKLKNIIFHCNSAQYSDAEQTYFNPLRSHLARIVWAFTKKHKWCKFTIEQELLALITTLLSTYHHEIIEDNRHQIHERELERLTRIVDYIGEHYAGKVQLQELADRECVTMHHLSRFFKEQMGISFQEYLFDYRIYQAAKQIINSNEKIADIAFACGFNDPKLFYKKFKQKYNQTPIKLRRQLSAPSNHPNGGSSYLSVRDRDIYKSLFEYLNTSTTEAKTATTPVPASSPISITTEEVIDNITPTWRKLTTFGCSYEGLKAQHRAQLAEMQSSLHFEYIRFQGIFAEQMHIVAAKGLYNWSNVDSLIDFLLSIRLKPFFCLGYMPDLFASNEQTVAHWRGNISPPEHMEDWTDLVAAFFHHIITRYGIEQVQTWYFEVWNEPDLEGVFWAGNEAEYHQLYLATYHVVKAVSPLIKLGGPSVSHMVFDRSDWLDNFIRFCHQHQLQPDFFSCHIYPELYGNIDNLMDSSKVSRKTLGPDGCLELLNSCRPYQQQLDIDELHITEWNLSACWGNKVLDTAFLGSFVVYNIIALYDKVSSLGIWTFSDLFEERGPSTSTFHGGFGMMTREGIKKPNFHALTMFNRLGPKLLKREKDFIITRSSQGIQILMVNYVHFDDLYASGDTSAIEMSDPYAAFNPAPNKLFDFAFDLPSGNYKLTRYMLNREHGSAYDDWLRMGAPEPLSEEDIDELKRTAYPKRSTQSLHHEGEALLVTSTVPEHGVELILLAF